MPNKYMGTNHAAMSSAESTDFSQTANIPKKTLASSKTRVSPQVRQSILASFYEHGLGVTGTARRTGLKNKIVERVIRDGSRIAS